MDCIVLLRERGRDSQWYGVMGVAVASHWMVTAQALVDVGSQNAEYFTTVPVSRLFLQV